MRSTLAVAGLLAVSACAQSPDVIVLEDIRDVRSALPGFSTEINCNDAPRYIFDKHGEIVETIHPILHPSCAELEAKEEARRKARALVKPSNEATDDDDPNGTRVVDVTTQPEVTNPTIPTTIPPVTPPTTIPHDDEHDEHDEHDDTECTDPDSCHDHPDHDPFRHDNEQERRDIHGITTTGS